MGSWYIGYRKNSGNLPRTVLLRDFNFIHPPVGYSYADPFVVDYKNRSFVFFEQFSNLDYFSGKIYVSELLNNHYTEPTLALSTGHHLSYPQVFSSRGRFFMLPESRQNGTIDLYEAIDFPYKWEKAYSMFTNIDAVDSTLIPFKDGKILLIYERDHLFKEKLRAYFSPTLFGPWQSSRLDSNVSHLRPAGTIFHVKKRAYRASQLSANGYGRGILISQITLVSKSLITEKFSHMPTLLSKEKKIWLHTYNMNESYEVIDILSF